MAKGREKRTPAGGFPTTLNSKLLAIRSPDPAMRARSFEALAHAYYKPVYKYTRLRWRKSQEEAADITQEFFERALEKGTFGGYDAGKARFRTYLRMCLDRFIAKRDRAGSAIKRGGASAIVPLDFAEPELEMERSGIAPGEAPPDYFDTEWVRNLLGTAVDTLRRECHARGKDEHFRVFERYDLHADADSRPSYAEVAAELGIAVTDVTNRLAYARREFRRIVLDTLRGVTASEEEFRSEALVALGIRL